MTTTTIELPDDVHAQVQELARTTGRPVGELLSEAVVQGLAYDRWFRAEVAKGLRSTEAGRLVPSEDMDALWRRLTTDNDLRAVRR